MDVLLNLYDSFGLLIELHLMEQKLNFVNFNIAGLELIAIKTVIFDINKYVDNI